MIGSTLYILVAGGGVTPESVVGGRKWWSGGGTIAGSHRNGIREKIRGARGDWQQPRRRNTRGSGWGKKALKKYHGCWQWVRGGKGGGGSGRTAIFVARKTTKILNIAGGQWDPTHGGARGVRHEPAQAHSRGWTCRGCEASRAKKV